MEKITWNVYNQFRCIAEKCTDSCCAGWEVDMDDAAVAYYRSLEGPLGERLNQVLQDGAMRLENGRCPMWRQDGLCEIQAQLGHDALCQVCREYPRLYMDYGDFAEWGLELSCPEAARLIFEGLAVTTEQVCGGTEPEYDPELMTILQKSRKEVLAFLENTAYSVPQTLAVILLFAHQVQGAVDGGAYVPLQPEDSLTLAEKYAGAPDYSLIIDFFKGLEILTQRWQKRLDNPQGGNWDRRLLTFAKYLIRRYWLQAVWDYDLVCRVKFIVTACILVNGLGGDTAATAQLFAKEIENDPDNREAILDGAYSQSAFTDANLLGLLIKITP